MRLNPHELLLRYRSVYRVFSLRVTYNSGRVLTPLTRYPFSLLWCEEVTLLRHRVSALWPDSLEDFGSNALMRTERRKDWAGKR